MLLCHMSEEESFWMLVSLARVSTQFQFPLYSYLSVLIFIWFIEIWNGWLVHGWATPRSSCHVHLPTVVISAFTTTRCSLARARGGRQHVLPGVAHHGYAFCEGARPQLFVWLTLFFRIWKPREFLYLFSPLVFCFVLHCVKGFTSQLHLTVAAHVWDVFLAEVLLV